MYPPSRILRWRPLPDSGLYIGIINCTRHEGTMDLTLLITVFHIRSTSTATLHIEEDQDLVLRAVRREALTAVLPSPLQVRRRFI